MCSSFPYLNWLDDKILPQKWDMRKGGTNLFEKGKVSLEEMNVSQYRKASRPASSKTSRARTKLPERFDILIT